MRNMRCLLALALIMVSAVSTANPSQLTNDSVSALEMTFVTAEPGMRRDLKSYIEQNWFAMDSIAVARGLMTSYELLENANKDGEWQFAVLVTYPQRKGYNGIAQEFEAIRAAHTETKINGKTWVELGRVINSIKVLRTNSITQGE